jgi:tripartite-type tricarboxylate transporter receptor subunit TctC
MKKIISVLAIALACFSASATPVTPQTVQLVWPFAVGGMGAMTRSLMDIANQQQSTYQFVFTHKPGAGSTVAANYVLSSNSLTVFANSDGMYTRPLMYNESHDPTQFQLVSATCTNIPLAIYSRRYTSVDNLKNKDVSVGIIPGTATQLFTRLLAANNPDLKFTDVSYKGIPESTVDVLGGHVDANVAFLGKTGSALGSGDVSLLGISGTRSFPGAPTFASLKIKGVEQLTNGYYIFVPRTVDAKIAQDLNRIFNNAANSDAFKEICTGERGTVESVTFVQTEKMHQSNMQQWTRLARGIAKQ